MKKKLQITEDSLQKAHDNGCSDVKKVLENMYPDFFEKEVETFRRGERISVDGHECIIAVVPNSGNKEFTIVDLRDGCHWGDSFKVKDYVKILITEMSSSISTCCTIKKIES